MRYEQIYTIWDIYDGIRTGTADLNGAPHYFSSLYDEVADEYSSNFRLYPVGIEFMQRAEHSWNIYCAWESKFHGGEVDLKTHPGHRGVDAEYDEVKLWLDDQIARLQALPTLYRAKFRELPGQEDRSWVVLKHEVTWSPSSD